MARKIQTALSIALLWIVSGFAAPLYAQQDCTEAKLVRTANFLKGPDCTISWVDNNQLQTVTWRAVPDDFWPASLERTVAGITLTSSNLPELIDIDQDGWQDMVTFTPIGSVNGSFDVFFYSPETAAFKHAQTLSGHTFERDISGYIVATGRNGPGQLLRFYTIEDQDFRFQFEINPYATPSSDSNRDFGCEISTLSSYNEIVIEGTMPQDHELLLYYCNPDPAPDRERRNFELLERVATSDRVPTKTVFYCRLEGGTHAVTISLTPVGIKYAYGSIGSDSTELIMERRMDQVEVLPQNGAGSSRFGEISFANGPFTYIASYYYKVFDDDGALLPSDPDIQSANPTFVRGLLVLKDGDGANPVFNRDCTLEHSFDAISTLK